jgi:hypothetical protein
MSLWIEEYKRIVALLTAMVNEDEVSAAKLATEIHAGGPEMVLRLAGFAGASIHALVLEIGSDMDTYLQTAAMRAATWEERVADEE